MNFKVEKIIKNPNFLKLAHRYCESRCVQTIFIEKNGDNYQITSDVKVREKTEKCTIKISGKKLTYHCDCVYCNSESPCAHVGAVMMKINQLYIKSFPFTYDVKSEKKKTVRKIGTEERVRNTKFDISRQFIKQTKKNYLSEIETIVKDKKIAILPIVEYKDQSLSLRFRIKIKNDSFFIKKIPEFLDDVKNEREVQYGLYVKFVHSESVFDDFARKQIHFMQDMVDLVNARTASYNWHEVEKTIPINDVNIDDFFEFYYQTDTIKNVNLKDGEDAFPIVIKYEKARLDSSYYLISCRDQCYVGNHGIYCLRENEQTLEIIRYQFDDKRIPSLVKEISHGKFMIAERDFPEFIKYVLSPIQDDLLIDSDVSLEINDYPYIKIYGDLDHNLRVRFQIYYENDRYERIRAFRPKFVKNYRQDLVEKYMRAHADDVDEEKGCAHFLLNGEKLDFFLHEGLQELMPYCDIYINDSVKQINKQKKYKFDIGVNVQNDLLTLDIQSIDIPDDEIASVLSRYRKHDKFYRLKSGNIIHLDSLELDELSQLLDKYHLDASDIHDGTIELMKNRIFSVGDAAEEFRRLQFNKSQDYEEIVERFSDKKENYELSPYYDELLRDYQKEGYAWLRTLYDYGFHGILADDMGLGKTLQVIALLDELQLDKPALVVCPASVMYNWESEIRKFALHLSVQCITGTGSKRSSKIAHVREYQVNITSYDYLRIDYRNYRNKEFSYVILDEAQYIKNPRTRNAIVAKELHADHRLALSGTPIENNLSELWSIFDFLMPHYLYSYYYFKSHFENKIALLHDEKKIKELQKFVSPFMLRRNKKDVLTELPEKIESVQMIDFNNEERKLYEAHMVQAYEQVRILLQSDHYDRMAIFAYMTQLRQLCNDPRLIYQDIDGMSMKMKACIELLREYKENNQKVLLFSSFPSMFKLLIEELNLNGISYLMLTGETTKEKRQQYVDTFQNGEADVFLISLKAGGTGLNLTKAEAVIHFDPWWNIAAQNQATDRAYRIGQEHNLNVHQLIMKGSIEEKILKLQEKKKELSELFVESSTGNITKLSKEEILELFTK